MASGDNPRDLSLLNSLQSTSTDGAEKARSTQQKIADGVTAPEAQVKSQVADIADAEKANAEVALRRKSPAAPEMRAAPDAQDYQVPSRPGVVSSEPVPGGAYHASLLIKLPQRGGRRSIGGIVSFIMCVLVPVMVASIYYIGYASDQYIAEFRFSVRDTNTATSTSDATSDLASMLGVGTTTSNPSENYMVVDYITSQQAVEDLQSKIDLRQIYARPFIDRWSRFDASEPIERFDTYWKYMVTASFDQITGTSVAQVRAFTPDDAFLIAKTLITLSEDLVNEIAQRPQRDAVRYAEGELKRAEDRLKKIRGELTEYRNKEAIIDPTSSVVTSNTTLASSLRSSLVQLQTDLATLQKQHLDVNSPQMKYTALRIKATQDQLKEVEAQVSSAKEGNNSISDVVARYEQLDLERQFAQTMVTSTMQSVEQARANSIAKQIYITPYVRPAMPQTSLYPDRFVSILTVAGGCFLLWTIALLIVRSIREHLA